jgi:hypothetical protein
MGTNICGTPSGDPYEEILKRWSVVVYLWLILRSVPQTLPELCAGAFAKNLPTRLPGYTK